jgi:hypothetical protein
MTNQEILINLANLRHLLSKLGGNWDTGLSHFLPNLDSNQVDGHYFLRNYQDLFEAFIQLSQLWQTISYPKQELKIYSLMASHAIMKVQMEEVVSILNAGLISDAMQIQNLKELTSNIKQKFNILSDINFISQLTSDITLREKVAVLKKVDASRTELLFHAVKTEHVKGILDRGSILGYTSHRFWDDGKRVKHDHPEYENAYWMKGISMTRDINFALGFGHIVLVFDRKAIKNNHSIEPYSWNHHFSDGGVNSKKEREDFVVLSKKKKRFQNCDSPEWVDEYNGIMELTPNEDYSEDELKEFKAKFARQLKQVNREDLGKPQGELKFQDALKGIIIRKTLLWIYGIDNELVQYILNHPLFNGILDD